MCLNFIFSGVDEFCYEKKLFLKSFHRTGAQFEGYLGEILTLGAEISPYMVSGRSGSLPKKKKKI